MRRRIGASYNYLRVMKARLQLLVCVATTAALLLLAGVIALAAAPMEAQAARPPDIGYHPSSPAAVAAMLKLAHVGPGDVVYDLGSGDGRIVIRAAREYGARGVGIELDPELVAISRKAAADAGVADKVTFIQADLFTADLSPATVVTLFLWPSVNDRLEQKLRRELRPGTRVVSLWFPIGRWVPDATVRMDDGRELFAWTVPRRPAREPDVPFVPTEPKVVDEMLALAEVGATDVVFDLGSGDGRIPIMAAQKYRARAVGIELDPSLVEISRSVAREGEVTDRVTFREGDLFDVDLSTATVITLCLSADVNARLETRLRRLRPGTRIVSRTFGIGNWPPDKVIKAKDGSELFLWVVR